MRQSWAFGRREETLVVGGVDRPVGRTRDKVVGNAHVQEEVRGQVDLDPPARVIYDRIAIAENDCSNSAHPINVLVAVDVPDPRPLCPLGIHW